MVGDDPVRSRVLRLDSLRVLLGDRDVTTAGDLAADLGVSLRTVQRDLVALRDLGMPIESDRGRGGGIRLQRGWSLGRVHLNESEALGMLLSLTIAEKIGSPLLLEDLRSIQHKVSAAFAPAQSRRIRALRRRVLVGGPASDRVLTNYSRPQASVTHGLMQAFLYQHVARSDTKTNPEPLPIARSRRSTSTTTCRCGMPSPGTVSATTSGSSASTGFIGSSLSRLTSDFDDQIHS